MNHISNIKISFNTEKEPLWLEKIKFKCSEENINKPMKKSNILILKNKYTFCIFEKKNNLLHFNVTGIKNYKELNEFESFFEKHFSSAKIINLKIDNITASFDINRRIDLVKLHKISEKVKYNPERFPGLFLKDFEKTCIIFKNGKIVILGCKNDKNISEIWEILLKRLINVITT